MAEGELRKLIDLMEIQKLKALYCAASDDAVEGYDVVGPVFDNILAEDVQADYGFGLIEGRDALVDFMVNSTAAKMEWLWHAIHTPLIAVDGDRASARWTILVQLKPKGASVRPLMTGRYHDELRRTADGWRFTKVRFIAMPASS